MPERMALGVREAADALGVSEDMIKRLIANGRLHSVRLGARRLIPIAGIHELLSEGDTE